MNRSIIIDNLAKYINTAIIILKDKEKIEFINEEARKALKIEKEKVTLSDIPQEIITIIKTKEKIERYEIKLGERIVGISISNTEDNGNNYTMMIFKDITEIKRKEQLNRQNEKFRLMGEVVVSLAHEIKNSLNLIRGFSQLVIESEDINLFKENHKNVITEVDRLNKMAKNMLDFTRKENIVKTKFDIVNFTKEIVANLGLESILDLKSNFDNIDIYADYDKMIQIYLNMIRNAVDAVSECDKKMIKIEIIKMEKIAIIFENSGTLKEDFDMSQIFTPYFSTKTDGNGLGLALTKKIVEEHGWDITVRKNNIGGLTFEIII